MGQGQGKPGEEGGAVPDQAGGELETSQAVIQDVEDEDGAYN